jgi:hypothetical protein
LAPKLLGHDHIADVDRYWDSIHEDVIIESRQKLDTQ